MILPNEAFLKNFKSTQGAISVAEAIAIMNIAMEVKIGGDWITLGAHAGKDTMSASYGFSTTGISGDYYMIDPCYDMGNAEAWEHTIQKKSENMGWLYFNEPGFCERVKERVKEVSNGLVNPILIGSYSEKEIPKHDKISWCFQDSDNHQPERVYSELELLKPRMIIGGIITMHDVGNQYITPKEALEQLIQSGEYENVPIDWKSIFDYVRENKLEEGNDSWHEKGSNEFPCYVGAVRKIK